MKESEQEAVEIVCLFGHGGELTTGATSPDESKGELEDPHP